MSRRRPGPSGRPDGTFGVVPQTAAVLPPASSRPDGTTAAATAAQPVADARRQFLPVRSLDVQVMLMGGEWK